MGQKTHPIGFRLGIVKQWMSRWFATKDMPALLKEDELIRKYLKTRLGHAAIAEIAHRAAAGQGHRDDAHRAAGRGDRQAGRRGRQAARRAGPAHRQGSGDQRRGDQAAGAVGPAGGRQHRAPAGAAHLLPPGDEARGAERHADGRPGHQGAGRRAGWAAPRSRGPRAIARAGCRCTRCAPTSTTPPSTAKTTYGTIGIKVWIFKGEVVEDCPAAPTAREPEPMLAPKRVKFRKTFKGRTKGHRHPRQHRGVRRVRAHDASSRAGSPTGRSRRRVSR